MKYKNKILKIKIKDINSKNGLAFIFFKIFIVFFLAMLPIVMHNLINVKHSYILGGGDMVGGTDKYIVAAQAIGYSQPMVFFSINCLVLITVNIINILKKSFNKTNIKQQPKEIINSGIVYIFLTSIIVGTLLVVVMNIYSYAVLDNFEYPIKTLLQKYLKEYVWMISIFVAIIGLSIYFEFVLLECGFNYWIIMSISIFLSMADILFSILLNFYSNLSPVESCVIGTIVPTFIQLIIFSSIFYKKIANWKPWDIKIYKKHVKLFWSSSWILSTYMFAYGFMMVIQMMYMSLIVRDDREKYLITESGQYTIIITRIIVYNILNLLIIIPKSMARAVTSRYIEKDTPYQKMTNYHKSMKICNWSLLVMVIFGLIIFIFSDKIISNLYEGNEWAMQKISSNYPIDFFGEDATYLTIIKEFFWRGLLFGIFSQLVINYSVCYRVTTYYYLDRNAKSFLVILSFFIIIYSTCNYFFGVYYQYIFRGLTGFMLTIIIYGTVSTIIIWYVSYSAKIKLINNWMIDKYDIQIDKNKKWNLFYCYSKIREYKQMLYSEEKKEYI